MSQTCVREVFPEISDELSFVILMEVFTKTGIVTERLFSEVAKSQIVQA
jgi:hypothetical protein